MNSNIIEEHALLFLNNNNKRNNPYDFIRNVKEYCRIYSRAVYKLFFLLAVRQVLEKEKDKHVLFCSERVYGICRFSNFYDNSLDQINEYIVFLNINQVINKLERKTQKSKKD